MSSKRALFLLGFAAIFVLTSCSGLKTACTTNCGGGGGTGTATLTLFLRATPLTPPASTNLLAFETSITGISLTPNTGSTVNINATAALDFVRMQSDTLIIFTDSNVPAGQYTSITVGFAGSKVTYCTQPTPGVAGCVAGSVAYASGTVASPTIPVTFSLSNKEQAGLEIDLNTAQVLTVSNQIVSAVNLATPSAFSVSTLPPAKSSLGTGQLEFLENILAEVDTVSGQQITFLTPLMPNGYFITTSKSSTYFSPNCLLDGTLCPPTRGQLANVDVAVNPDGSMTLLSFDPLSSVMLPWIDGVVISPPSSSTQFQIVVGQQPETSQLPSGSLVNVTLATPLSFGFFIDSKGLTVPPNNIAGSTDATVLLPGMTVGLDVTAFTPASGNTPAAVTASLVILRFSTVAGAVANPTQNSFFIQSLPSFFGLTSSAVYPSAVTPATNFDGVTAATGLTVGQTVAIRALYLGPNPVPPFVPAKVRAF